MLFVLVTDMTWTFKVSLLLYKVLSWETGYLPNLILRKSDKYRRETFKITLMKESLETINVDK